MRVQVRVRRSKPYGNSGAKLYDYDTFTRPPKYSYLCYIDFAITSYNTRIAGLLCAVLIPVLRYDTILEYTVGVRLLYERILYGRRILFELQYGTSTVYSYKYE